MKVSVLTGPWPQHSVFWPLKWAHCFILPSLLPRLHETRVGNCSMDWALRRSRRPPSGQEAQVPTCRA